MWGLSGEASVEPKLFWWDRIEPIQLLHCIIDYKETAYWLSIINWGSISKYVIMLSPFSARQAVLTKPLLQNDETLHHGLRGVTFGKSFTKRSTLGIDFFANFHLIHDFFVGGSHFWCEIFDWIQLICSKIEKEKLNLFILAPKNLARIFGCK